MYRIGLVGGKEYVNEMKVVKIILVVIGVFVVCWFLFFVIVVGYVIDKNFIYFMEVFNMFKWMEYLNLCLNFVIYICMNCIYR